MAIKVNNTTIINDDKELSSGLKSVFDRVFAVGVNTTLQVRDFCEVTGAGLTITLPASPEPGNELKIGVGTFTDTVVARNGSNIASLAEDFTIDIENVNVGFLYVDSSVGWRVY